MKQADTAPHSGLRPEPSVSEEGGIRTWTSSHRPSADFPGYEGRLLPAVTLVCTVYNESATITGFLESLYAMTRLPAECVIVDGGSTDGTVEAIGAFVRARPEPVRFHVITDPTCNIRHTPGPIAKGRNTAIRSASGTIIASTDAGCVLCADWLERITGPLLADPTLGAVGGWYRADARSYFARCAGVAMLIPPEAVDKDRFIPSSRSFAFSKAAWEKVGGYPEKALAAEDTLFVMYLRNAGFSIAYVAEAVVYWRMKTSFRSFVRLIFRYGFGDGFCSILMRNFLRNVAKIGISAALIVAAAVVHPVFLLLLAVYWWLLPYSRKIPRAFAFSAITMMPVVSILKLTSDIAYAAGYVAGRMSKRHPVFLRVD